MHNIIRKGMIILCISSFATAAYSNNVNQILNSMATQPSITQEGKILFEQVCASCHSKDLSGASGFNLKDGEWIHGNEPSQIIENVKRGFMKAGMPAFDGVFSEKQLQSIVAYVLSKREGFDGLSYKIYQMDDATDKELTPKKLIKTGTLSSNLPDFQLPEIKYYTIEFEGDFYASKEEATKVWAEWGFPLDINFFVNGMKVDRSGKPWYPTWDLKKGKQHLKIIYRSGDNKPNHKNASLIVTNSDMTIKLFPLSTRAKLALSDNKLEVKATEKTVILRKKIHKLPTYSISVGLPSKVNYAFNTRSCSVVGLWKGDLLNIGPNISGRGESSSLPLGDWLFHSPESLQLKNISNESCTYDGYQLINNEPEFTFQVGKHLFTLSAESNKSDEIIFNYHLLNNPNTSAINFALPKTTSIIWKTSNGTIKHDSATITPDSSGKFSIIATFIQ